MSKLPTFLHLANLKAAPGREFILHTGRPSFLAEVFKFETDEQIVQFGQHFMQLCEAQKATCIASRSRKPWNGIHYFFAAVQVYENYENTQAEADRVTRIARRMADFYLYNVLNQ